MLTFIRSALFSAVYWVVSILYVFLAALSQIVPTRQELTTKKRFFVIRWIASILDGNHDTVTSWIVSRYSLRMVQTLRLICGIKLNVVGKENVPPQAIIAAKHHSWFDGFSMFVQFRRPISFVTGDHLEKFPLMKGVLRSIGAVVVSSCGGHETRKSLKSNAGLVLASGRSILIYPEGHLSAPGTYHKYRTGVYHMYRDHGVPVVPVATNLGCFAQQEKFLKRAGTATLQFLEPIPPGLAKDEFMTRLEQAIERQSDILIAEAQGEQVVPSVLAQPQSSIKEVLNNLNSLS